MFWNGWPSWIVELGSGAVAVLLTAYLPPILGLLAATACSLIYERWLDRNGWSWSDIGQRSLGIMLAWSLWTFLRGGW